MSGEEAKNVLDAVGGLMLSAIITSNTKKDDTLMKLMEKYSEAVEMAKDAINLMDKRLDIEKGN